MTVRTLQRTAPPALAGVALYGGGNRPFPFPVWDKKYIMFSTPIFIDCVFLTLPIEIWYNRWIHRKRVEDYDVCF